MAPDTPLPADGARLSRFIQAQERGGAYERALAEVRAGAKRGHWIWFVLPQLRGLGRSAMAQEFGLDGAAEARAYLAHPVLGARLVEMARAVLGAGEHGAPAEVVMGSGVDALKLRSSMTLFAVTSRESATPAEGGGLPSTAPTGPTGLFDRVLERYFDGAADPLTLAMLAGR